MFTFANTTSTLVNILPTKHFLAFVHYSNNGSASSNNPLQLESPKRSSSSRGPSPKQNDAPDLMSPRASTMTAFQPLTLTPIEFSLTEGTQIPAPLPESPPLTPKATRLPSLEEEKSDAENTRPDASHPRQSNSNTTNPDLSAPLSPLSTASPMSHPPRNTGIRKFLSLRSLRGESRKHRGEMSPTGSTMTYAPHSPSRPGSPYTTDTALSAETSHSRKNSGWFGSVSGRRKSQMYVVGRLDERLANSISPEQNKATGPPPPAIPEFSLGKQLEMGGDDLFKNIK